jgi:predicted DNA-binding protein
MAILKRQAAHRGRLNKSKPCVNSSLTLPVEVWQRVDKVAEEYSMTRSAVIGFILTKSLKIPSIDDLFLKESPWERVNSELQSAKKEALERDEIEKTRRLDAFKRVTLQSRYSEEDTRQLAIRHKQIAFEDYGLDIPLEDYLNHLKK